MSAHAPGWNRVVLGRSRVHGAVPRWLAGAHHAWLNDQHSCVASRFSSCWSYSKAVQARARTGTMDVSYLCHADKGT